MTTEQAAFLASIRANPEDDVSRLAYADFLQEHGDEDRAEFIRVQVDRARRAYGRGCRPCERHAVAARAFNMNAVSQGCRICRALRAREFALLGANPGWLPVCPACDGRNSRSKPGRPAWSCSHCSGSGRCPGVFTRGLLDEVSVPTMGHVLERCNWTDCDNGTFRISIKGEYVEAPCGVCNGTGWQPTPWASKLLRDHPTVTRIVVLEWCDTDLFLQQRDDVVYDNPPTIPALLCPKEEFATREAAVDALSRKVCTVVRQKVSAGLTSA